MHFLTFFEFFGTQVTTMLSNLLTAATLFFTLLDTTLAQRNVWSITENGVGATIAMKNDAAVETGFHATVYDYPWGDFIPFWNDNFVAGGYSTRKVLSSTVSVTDPNFHFTDHVGSANLYGMLNTNMVNVLVELKGFYYGTYLLFSTVTTWF